MVQESIWFAAGSALFFTAVAGFILFAVTRGDIRSQLYFLPPIHAAVAGLAYLGMALVATERLGGLASIPLLRFGDWIISTPIITYYLARLSGTEARTRWIGVGTNVAMIAVGFAFIQLAGPARWVAFAVSTLLFVALIWLFFRAFGRTVANAAATTQSLFASLRDLTVATWSLYPIVYFAGPVGVGVLQSTDLNFAVAILDIFAKVGFMTIMLVRHYELETFTEAGVASVSD